MAKDYVIYEFTYIDKKTKEKKVIFASNVDTADLIIDIHNQFNTFMFDRKKFRFKRKVLVSVPPSVLEHQQLDTAEQERQTRIDKIKKDEE